MINHRKELDAPVSNATHSFYISVYGLKAINNLFNEYEKYNERKVDLCYIDNAHDDLVLKTILLRGIQAINRSNV